LHPSQGLEGKGKTRILSSIEDLSQTYSIRVEVRVWGIGLGIGIGGWVMVDLDLQSQESYGHDPYICKRSRSKVIQFKKMSGNRRTDRYLDGWTEAICITSRANTVGN